MSCCIRLLNSVAVSSLFSGVALFLVASVWLAQVRPASAASARSGGLNEGLLIEAEVKQGVQVIAGRVLIEAGLGEWALIAATPSSAAGAGKRSGPTLRLEARAKLIEPDVVEVETRVTAQGNDGNASRGQEQTGKLIVRIGERGEMTSSQLESSGAGSGPKPETSVGVKVLRVRYSL